MKGACAIWIGLGVLVAQAAGARAQQYSVLKIFTGTDGAEPNGGLALSGGTLYGTTAQGGGAAAGTLFRLNTDGSGFSVLRSFRGPDGGYPLSGLVLAGSTLYGTTERGGTTNDGTVFKLNTDGTGFATLHSFTGASDGAYPVGTLILSGSTLYGTTTGGGNLGCGTVFELNTDGSGFASLAEFTGQDGNSPHGRLVLSGNTLYGTTGTGGSFDYGTVFKLNTDSSGWAVLKSFNGTNEGGAVDAGLVMVGNTLYGRTAETVFRVNTDGSGFAVIGNVLGNAGAEGAGLTVSGGTLYGISSGDGSFGHGTVFKVNTDGSGMYDLKSFAATDGTVSPGNLLVSGGTLYGTRGDGGPGGQGSVFSLVLEPTEPPTARVPLLWQTVRLPPAGEFLVLAWTNSSFVLQAAPSVTGAYTNVPGASSPFAVAVGGPQMFFRLQANP